MDDDQGGAHGSAIFWHSFVMYVPMREMRATQHREHQDAYLWYGTIMYGTLLRAEKVISGPFCGLTPLFYRCKFFWYGSCTVCTSCDNLFCVDCVDVKHCFQCHQKTCSDCVSTVGCRNCDDDNISSVSPVP